MAEKNEVLTIPQSIWNSAVPFEEYLNMLEVLWAKGQTTGDEQSEGRLETAGLNINRMKRLIRQIKPDEDVLQEIPDHKGMRFLLIVEGWCGDAAQEVPIIENILGAKGWESRYILRDENPGIMDKFLTNGSRSIPVVIPLTEELVVAGEHWGPRPHVLQSQVQNWRKYLSSAEWHKELHQWYAQNKGVLIQEDFIDWLKSI